MTFETFKNELLTPVIMEDYDSRIGTEDEYLQIYRVFKFLLDEWPYITEIQKNCYLMATDMNLTQNKIAEYLRIKQSTVSEHIKKARENYIHLVRVVYYSTLWGIDYGVRKKE